MLPKSEIKIETMRGTGPGGQRKNKVETCVRATHIPTGVTVTVDTRSQAASMKMALKELEARLIEAKKQEKASAKKARRDHAIHNETTVRTYDFKKGIVKDHRSGKTASLKDVLVKGRIDLLHE